MLIRTSWKHGDRVRLPSPPPHSLVAKSNMKNTLVIAYNGGAYGTYLEWAINSLTTTDEIVAPFTVSGPQKGNSHRTKLGKQLLNISEWRKYVCSDKEYPTIRMHPKTLSHESVKHNLEEILKDTSKVVLIYPDPAHELLCINNFMSKVWNVKNPFEGPLREINLDDIYKNFPVSRDTPTSDIPRWILREHLSYYLVPAWRSQVDWFLPDNWQHENCLVVFIDELLYNFESTVKRLQTFAGLDFKRDISDLREFHQQMLGLQIYIEQNKLCASIVDSVVDNDLYLEWDDLSLASESWIQWKLRELGYELKCNDLNCFPSNTTDLKRLLDPA